MTLESSLDVRSYELLPSASSRPGIPYIDCVVSLCPTPGFDTDTRAHARCTWTCYVRYLVGYFKSSRKPIRVKPFRFIVLRLKIKERQSLRKAKTRSAGMGSNFDGIPGYFSRMCLINYRRCSVHINIFGARVTCIAFKIGSIPGSLIPRRHKVMFRPFFRSA